MPVPTGQRWSDEMDATLKRMAAEKTVPRLIALELDCDPKSVKRRAKRLGVKLTHGRTFQLKRLGKPKVSEPSPLMMPDLTLVRTGPRSYKISGPVKGSTPRHWETRKLYECCWPVEGEGADLKSCCLPVLFAGTDNHKPYCRAHYKRSVQRNRTDAEIAADNARRLAYAKKKQQAHGLNFSSRGKT